MIKDDGTVIHFNNPKVRFGWRVLIENMKLITCPTRTGLGEQAQSDFTFSITNIRFSLKFFSRSEVGIGWFSWFRSFFVHLTA